MERFAPVGERRFERIEDLVGPPCLNAVHQVVAEDDLSKPIAQQRRRPRVASAARSPADGASVRDGRE
ncbi:hypothetical protein AB0D10_14480 [Kitasatospora sp. NPDC048545]|uniref:hypothetical protein n=1 Tax=Kitasatospora sp. NPDC048545 TaxID=3157208 RepID=UPI0033FB4934